MAPYMNTECRTAKQWRSEGSAVGAGRTGRHLL